MNNKSSISVRITSSELFGLLSQYPDFARCGVSYIVNLGYIHSIDPKNVLMKNDAKIKIPRGSYQLLKDKFFQFFYKRSY